ncbi:MAG: phosphoribosylanthranilate isomerase [Oscillospiraceae bacterium]|jgi:phosphoribosylanthranilate isomerase
MSGTKVKICGLTREQDIQAANRIRPDYIGFVFAESRRRVTAEQAKRLRERLEPGIVPVGVFVNAPEKEILALLAEGIVDMAQLHGDEDETFVRRIREYSGKPVIKAVKVLSEQNVLRWRNSQADYLLLDSGAGSGKRFDWSFARCCDRPFFLAGGLDAANVVQAVRQVQPYAVDLSSGAETDGVKDPEKMERIVRSVRDE